ncbi:ywqA [Symbiodinium sp. CCMP2592]|nr:ywqA [Symbiodinium sp. CCMP2592]
MSSSTAFAMLSVAGPRPDLASSRKAFPIAWQPSAASLQGASGSSGAQLLSSSAAITVAALAMRHMTQRNRSNSSRVAVAAQCKKTQCVHPDKPMMFACADCPRRGVAPELDEEPLAAAAFLGESVPSNTCSKKTQCVHPDKPMMFACADCPRRGVAPELDEEPLAAAAFLGESIPCNTCSKKTQCVHPDKPMMFACADCPRRGVAPELGEEPLAAAAFLGESVPSNTCSKKTQCVHPDKPMMFACADCPRRGVAPELDEEPLAAAAFLGESIPCNTCSKKTQCVHPDKPMMFACADCPRRGVAPELDEEPLAAAAFLGESVPSNTCSKKTQCVHPDKPMMFACADCPRRGVAPELDEEPERFNGQAQDQDINDSGKLVELFNLLRGIVARREKVLVFFCRTVTSKLLAALMEREFGVRPGILQGDTPHNERERIVREFKATPIPGEPQSQVLLLSVWVGAVGLNLPEARWVVHVERVWNPALERQATSRAHRLTSRKPVKAYCLFMQDTLEERKASVLSSKYRLSTNVMEALDLEQDEVGEEGNSDELGKAHGEELRALLGGSSSSPETPLEQSWQNSPEDEAALAEADPEESKEPSSDEEDDDPGKPKGDRCPLYPALARLRPLRFKRKMWVGKYGNPEDEELWDWYTVKGHREVHERAPACSTAGREKLRRKGHSIVPFSSRPSRIRHVGERGDRIVTVALAEGVTCRLFIPSESQQMFSEDEQGIFAQPAKSGDAAFPVLTPSSGRSAIDEEVGLLDITPGMVDETSQPLKFLQIVAVKPSEVENYRTSSPFFVVMELPTECTVNHPCYGKQRPEDLGIGCARHWLVRLAAALRMTYAFFLDDTVRSWRGVTLVEDTQSLFGVPSDSTKARFTPVPLSRVMSYLAEPKFLKEDMPEFASFGFARMAPEFLTVRKAFCRTHVYSGYLLNISKIERERLNFKQEQFIWEDLVFNLDCHDVVRCNRFAMVKVPFSSGGCSAQLARSDKATFVRAGYLGKLSGEDIVAETLGQVPEKTGKGKRGRKKVVKGPPEAQEPERPVPSDPFILEEDPALKPEGAVVDESGSLVNSYYKRFIQAFKDAEKARADVAAPTGIKRPGVRRGEEIPAAVMFWDDSLRPNANVQRGATHLKDGQQWGAGYIAKPYGPVKKSKWFNVKTWGCWRMAFVLARLQYQVWQLKHPDVPEPKGRGPGKKSDTPKESKSSKKSSVEAKSSAAGKENQDPGPEIFQTAGICGYRISGSFMTSEMWGIGIECYPPSRGRSGQGWE